MTPVPNQPPLEQVLAQRLFDGTKPPPEIVPAYLIYDVPMGTPSIVFECPAVHALRVSSGFRRANPEAASGLRVDGWALRHPLAEEP